MLTHLNLVMNATVNVFDANDARPTDVVLGCLPLFHTFGQTVGMNGTFRLGATLVLLARFTGEAAIELMVRENVDVFHGVPTMYIGAAGGRRRAATGCRSCGSCISGGASLPVAVLEKFNAAFGTTIFEGYGLSETSPTATTNQPHFGTRPGTVGHPIWGVEVEIARAEIDDRIELLPAGELGEIVIRGPQRLRRLPRPARGHRAGAGRRLVPHRRPGHQGRRRASSPSSTARRTWSSAAGSTSTRARSRRCWPGTPRSPRSR